MSRHAAPQRSDRDEGVKQTGSSARGPSESISTPAANLSARQNRILSMQHTHGNHFVSRLLAARTTQTPSAGIGGKGAEAFQEILLQTHQANGAAAATGTAAPDNGSVQTKSLLDRFTGGKSDPHRNVDRSAVLRDDLPDPSVATDPPAPADNVLTKSTVSEPTPGPSGEYNWVVQWQLNDASPAGGWIVQGINVTGNITNPSGAVPTGWDPFVPYWEAWPVRPGQSVTTYAQGGDVADDTFANASFPADTTGGLLEDGSAVFYEGLTLPDSFSVHSNHPAGMLPITTSDPGLTGGTSPLVHSLVAHWDGSSGNTDTTLATQ